MSEQTGTLTGMWSIAQIGLATTATPTFFEPAKILHSNGTEKRYLEASFWTADPTPEILTLAAPAGEPFHEAVSTIVSIGVYGPPYNRFAPGRGPFQKLKFPIGRIGARDHELHLALKEKFRATSLEYVRLEIQKIGGIEIDTWKGKWGTDTLVLVRRKTNEYLFDSAEVREQIHATAGRLVDCRRSRAEVDLDRWEVFCHGVEYACTMARCPVIDQTFKDRRGLRSHLEKVHRLDPGKVEPLLDEGKRFPLYEESG